MYVKYHCGVRNVLQELQKRTYYVCKSENATNIEKPRTNL